MPNMYRRVEGEAIILSDTALQDTGSEALLAALQGGPAGLTISHVFDDGGLGGAVLEADGVADLVATFDVQF